MKLKQKKVKEIISTVIKNFDRIQIQTHYKDVCWSIDLVDRSSLAKYNKNYKFIFTIIDNHTTYAWAIPLKDKSGKSTTTAAFKKLIETSKRKPKKVWSDRGKEFYNKTFLEFLKQNEIQIYSTNSDSKAVFVERFNRTLLDLIKEPIYIEGKACWLNHLDAVLEKYNNRVHTTTRMTPFEAGNDKPISIIIPSKNRKIPKFQVGDFVRVPDKRNFFSKRYTTNWIRARFKIHKMNPTNPVTYGLEDKNNEQVEGKYYEQEFLRRVFNFESNQKVLESMNIFNQFE